MDLLRPPFFQTPTHARKTQERHRRNTPEKRNTPETPEGDGRTNGGTRQSYGRNAEETQEEHAGNPALSAEVSTIFKGTEERGQTNSKKLPPGRPK